MCKIIIHKNPNGDTRTARGNVDFETFARANDMHRQDVANIMNMLSERICKEGQDHDFTKKTHEEKFYKDFTESRKNDTNFTESEWYQMHIVRERHHLNSKCPEDVNLIDVLEMISDCIAAGLARSGEYRDTELSPEILLNAVRNTEKLILNNVELKE